MTLADRLIERVTRWPGDRGQVGRGVRMTMLAEALALPYGKAAYAELRDALLAVGMSPASIQPEAVEVRARWLAWAAADAIRAAQSETPPGKGGVSVNAVSSEETPQ